MKRRASDRRAVGAAPWLVLASLNCCVAAAFAQASDEKGPAFFGLSLEQLAEVKVAAASFVAVAQSRAPAIVSVIGREEIEAWGDRSVADALARVPGLYRVDAQGFQDLGVRGLFGGQRAWNRQVKLMIDGQPQAFRPDAANFLSAALMPMSTIDRIEVVRGPSSALYGADAFLATVNVVTRKHYVGANDASLRARAYGGRANGLDFSVAGGNGRLGLLFAMQAERYQLNDLRVPKSSPILGAQPSLRDLKSSDAWQRPLSLLARASLDTGALQNSWRSTIRALTAWLSSWILERSALAIAIHNTARRPVGRRSGKSARNGRPGFAGISVEQRQAPQSDSRSTQTPTTHRGTFLPWPMIWA